MCVCEPSGREGGRTHTHTHTTTHTPHTHTHTTTHTPHTHTPQPTPYTHASTLTRILGLLGVGVDDRNRELGAVRPAGEKGVVVGDAQEEGQVVGHVAALGVDEDVPVDSGWVGGRKVGACECVCVCVLGEGGRVGPTRERGRRGRMGWCLFPLCPRPPAPPAHTHSPTHTTHHLCPPTSNTVDRSSRFATSAKPSTRHVKRPYRDEGDGPVWSVVGGCCKGEASVKRDVQAV